MANPDIELSGGVLKTMAQNHAGSEEISPEICPLRETVSNHQSDYQWRLDQELLFFVSFESEALFLLPNIPDIYFSKVE